MSSMTTTQYDSDDAVELLMFTAAHESKLGTYLVQLNGGPAKGVFQFEPTTWNDIFTNYLDYRPALLDTVKSFGIPDMPIEMNVEGNLAMQIVMARVHYLRVPRPLPSKTNYRAMAEYYKKYWNTIKGKATVDAAIDSYIKYAIQGG
jgi:hypothetical protein